MKEGERMLLKLLLFVSLIPYAFIISDLPSHCTLWDVAGSEWEIYFSQALTQNGSSESHGACSHTRPDDILSVLRMEHPAFIATRNGTLKLEKIDSDGKAIAQLCLLSENCEQAQWSMVYDESIHIKNVNGLELIMNFVYRPKDESTLTKNLTKASFYDSFCGEVFTGWYVDFTTNSRGCVWAKAKIPIPPHSSDAQAEISDHEGPEVDMVSNDNWLLQLQSKLTSREKVRQVSKSRHKAEQAQKHWHETKTFIDESIFVPSQDVVDRINLQQKAWVAHVDSAKFLNGLKNKEAKMHIGGVGGEKSSVLDATTTTTTTAKNGLSLSLNSIVNETKKAEEIERRTCIENLLPKEFDWTKTIGETPVYNQHSCGSCYAVAAVDSASSRYRIMKNISFSFSAQNILDCSPNNQGCAGGFPFLVGWSAKTDGLISEACNPYHGSPYKTIHPMDDLPNTCIEKELSCNRTFASDFEYIGGRYGAGNAADMMMSLVQHGPFVAAIDPKSAFFYYKSGIFSAPTPLTYISETKIGSQSVATSDWISYWQATTHAVVVVGYGELNGKKIWRVKNSWGTGWGEGGYFNVERGVNSIAIESMPVSIVMAPKGTFGNPKFVDLVKSKYDSLSEKCQSLLRNHLNL